MTATILVYDFVNGLSRYDHDVITPPLIPAHSKISRAYVTIVDDYANISTFQYCVKIPISVKWS